MNSPAITIVNDRREFTFTEIINGTFRKWPIAARIISLRRNDVAVGASRHQAILHFAGRRQVVRQPQSHRQQDNRDGQSSDCWAPVSTLVGVCHGAVIPDTNNWRWLADTIFAVVICGSAATRQDHDRLANAFPQAIDASYWTC
jgi:hypothetical protein